ncbi:Serine/threonine-protein kinase ssp1 [Echria macrotheca]|uniref:non-specific serine/threonine protein kinase n=1 Tax=Echria macrotheca TaxID=438768 RepID=A0AAJ0BMY3_9PEZI|nr:Serine/threonine-protein kinase ssp1 [Echria macrotheca]
MEPQPPQQAQPHSRPALQNILPLSQQLPQRTANSTPVSSPGLFSPALPRQTMTFPSHSASESGPLAIGASPFLHPLQSRNHKVRETNKANVDHDYTTGRKLINQYEIIEELGRGVHGKVKLARNLETGENVAIKIIPRFSKKRRLGKVMSTQDKSKREIAILKKIRHANVVALLEIIDDPELKKIYMVLEFAECGEITWRKKGLPHICAFERLRQEREMRGIPMTPEEERVDRDLSQRQLANDQRRQKMDVVQSVAAAGAANNYWSLEHGGADQDEPVARSYGREDWDMALRSAGSQPRSRAASKSTSRAPSRNQSIKSMSGTGTPHPLDSELVHLSYEDDMETPSAALRSNPVAAAALEGTMYGPYADDAGLRERSPSMADSILSHLSSIDGNRIHDPYAEDFSFVPCYTIEHARHTFRDTVLGLEYLHYQGVVHRDIKPPNLLQTKEYRVKISDFGVSYFGRPVRDGDETISESEAQDFDDDLELAKTVGTPAFFAPELCYTESYDDGRPDVQPRITEQIDVWSLGVTLFCLIYARIPFIGEDEWHMFRKIATEEVYLPKKRLRPVDPATKPSEKSLYTRVNGPPYRNDDALEYEDVDKDLLDLLSKMLIKNPEKRIRLRDVKRHPFTTKGIEDVIAWLDDSDPSRHAHGRKIQVDDREVARAVVPLTFLEKAQSAVKKAVRKVIHRDRADSVSVSSRKRAPSSAASSGGDSPLNGSSTPNLRDARRKSIRPDDYFSSLSQPASEHPLTRSVVASPSHSPLDDSPQKQLSSSAGTHSTRQLLERLVASQPTGELPDRHWGSLHRTFSRHGHHHSVTNVFPSLTATPVETRTMTPTPLFDSQCEDVNSTLRKARDMRPPSEDSNRARSVDRGLFASSDKRAGAKVSLSTAVAPGNVHFSQRTSFSPNASPVRGYQNGYPQSDSNIHDKKRLSAELDERPLTARRILPEAEAKCQLGSHRPSPLSCVAPSRTGLSIDGPSRTETVSFAPDAEPALIPCPPSPDEGIFMQRPRPPSREETIVTAVSSSSTSMGALATTPLTSPSETASPIYMVNPLSTKDITEQILAFQSDPSLPALLSSTSSVSADLEGEFLGNPGVVGQSSVIDTTESLTPPAFAKESISGFPLDAQEDVLQGAVPVKLDESVLGRPLQTAAESAASQQECEDGDGEDSDSDDGLTMARRKKKSVVSSEPHTMSRMVGAVRRRDTNASIGSTETAKKLIVDSD